MNIRKAIRNLLARFDNWLDKPIAVISGESLRGGDAGDVNFTVRKPGEGSIPVLDGEPGSFVFKFEGVEAPVLQLKASGEIFVNGELVDTDLEACKAFTAWIKTTQIEAHAGVLNGGDATMS